jgi:hypothetical protein
MDSSFFLGTPCIYINSQAQVGERMHTLYVYSTAEYCCPVWKNGAHVNKIYAQLNTTIRLITGTTLTPWLHVLAHIIPYDIRRKYVTKRTCTP